MEDHHIASLRRVGEGQIPLVLSLHVPEGHELGQALYVDPEVGQLVYHQELAAIQVRLHALSLDLEVLYADLDNEKYKEGKDYCLGQLPYDASHLVDPYSWSN